MNYKKIIKTAVISLALGVMLFGLTTRAQAAPEFNTNPYDPADWFTGEVRENIENDKDPFSAQPGDEVLLVFYYHNNKVGTVAENTRMRIEFPTERKEKIILNGSITADNANPKTITDTLTINLPSAQKLEFHEWAYWFPADNPSDMTYIPVEEYGNYVQAVRGDVKGCLEYRGYVVFSARVSDYVPPAPPTVDLKVNGSDGPITVDYESDVKLSWTSNNADSCTASGGWSGTKAVNGNEWRYNLTSDKEYHITCTGPGGTASDSVKVYVREAPTPTLYVNLEAIPDSGEEPLKDVDLKATVSGSAAGPIDYKFDCNNDGSWDYTYSGISDNPKTVYNACDYETAGTYTAKVRVERDTAAPAEDTAAINVTHAPIPPTVDLKVNASNGPITVDYESDVKLSWTSNNADSCTASGGWSGTKAVNGNEWRYNLTSDKEYHITCTGPGGTASDSVKVYVREAPTPTLYVNLEAIPDSGEEPLKDVDLKATVSGSAAGPIDYKFDCNNDGSWDYTYSGISDQVFRVNNACDYDTHGSYTAKVTVYRQGRTASDTAIIEVQAKDKSLSVQLEAIPDSGEAPLKDVDLKATVSGSATGSMTYKFDCDNNGTWEYIYTGVYDEEFEINNACDYNDPGTHRARVRVERAGLSATDTDTIQVTEVEGVVTFTVEKKVRNLTEGETSWKNSTYASPSDKLQYRIVVYAPEDESVSEITVKDTIPSRVHWYGNLEIEGKSSSGDITQGIDIKSIPAEGKVIITFEILLEGKEKFGYGTTDLVNTVVASNEDYSVTDTSSVFAKRTAVETVTDVPTGALDNALIALGATILVSYALLLIYLFHNKVAGEQTLALDGVTGAITDKMVDVYYTVRPWYTKEYSERKLRKKIEQIRG